MDNERNTRYTTTNFRRNLKMATKKFTVKETIGNVLNANENARKRKQAEIKNKILAGAVPVSIGITAIVTKHVTNKTFKNTINSLRKRNDEVMEKANDIVTKAEDKINDFVEVMGGEHDD